MPNYPPSQIWNCDEFDIQACQNWSALVLAWTCLRTIQSIMLDECEWLYVLSYINVVSITLPNFYIFKGKHFAHNFITKCEFSPTMVMQLKT